MTGSASVETISRASDSELAEAARDGSLDAFGALFARTRDRVHSFVARSVGRREDAEDIVQEAYCRAWSRIGSFRGESAFLTWLMSIAANLCRDHYRSPHRRIAPASELDIDEADLVGSTCEPDSAAAITVRNALGQLSVENRMLVILCDVEGLTHKEAAAIVGGTQLSVRVRLHRARKKLRELLSEALDEVE